MPLVKSEIKEILVISLSNLGDVILTFPVMDILRRDFPSARLSVVVGPKAESLLQQNPDIHKVFVFNKRASIKEKIAWILSLRRKHYDLVVDLRNTAIPFLISAKYRTAPRVAGAKKTHMKLKHLNRLRSVFDFGTESADRQSLHATGTDKSYSDDIIRTKIGPGQKFIVVGPGAANHIKRWTEAGFASLCDRLSAAYKMKIVLVGDENDRAVAQVIAKQMKIAPVDLCGQTSLPQLGEIIKRAALVIVNDSAIMHLASYLDAPTLALFGPTDPEKYGPWSSRSFVVKKDIFCAPCEKSGCAYKHECMEHIQPDEVFNAIKFDAQGVAFRHE